MSTLEELLSADTAPRLSEFTDQSLGGNDGQDFAVKGDLFEWTVAQHEPAPLAEVTVKIDTSDLERLLSRFDAMVLSFETAMKRFAEMIEETGAAAATPSTIRIGHGDLMVSDGIDGWVNVGGIEGATATWYTTEYPN